MSEPKTAEQWRREYDTDKMDARMKGIPRKLTFSTGDFVRAVQADAIAHGMELAAEIFHRRCTHTDSEQEQTYFGNASELKAYDEILDTAQKARQT